MKLGTDSLEAFYEVSRRGAEAAAGRVTHMTGVDTRVDRTDCLFVTGADLPALLADAGRVGVRTRLTDGLWGDALVTLPREAAAAFADGTGAGGECDAADVLAEVGSVLNNGFIDPWADRTGTAVGVSPPRVMTGDADAHRDALDATPASDALGLLFHSRLRTAGGTPLDHFLVLHPDVLTALTSDGGGVEAATFAAFDRMTRAGEQQVAETVGTMTGLDCRVARRRGRFVPFDAVTERFADERRYCVAFEFDGPSLAGYLAFLFDGASARTVVERTCEASPSAGGLDDLGVSALRELGNVTASDLLDAWTAFLGDPIGHSTPAFSHDLGRATVAPLLARLPAADTHTYAFEVEIAGPEGFGCTALALPDGQTLQAALDGHEAVAGDASPVAGAE